MPENKEKKTMEEQLVELVEGIEKGNPELDLAVTPLIFRWTYDQRPDINWELMVSKSNEDDSDEEYNAYDYSDAPVTIH